MSIEITDVENKIREIFHKLLKNSEIGVNDKFLDSGGTSQGLVELTSYVCTQFSVDIELIDVFENQTIALLAKIVMQEVVTD